MNKKAKPMKWLKDIKDYFFDNRLYLAALIFFTLDLKLFWFLSIFNLTILFMLVPFLCIFWQFWINSKDKIPVSKSSLLTFSSIILAIFFFLFQSFQDEYGRLITMSMLNAHNCSVAKTYTHELENNGDQFGLNSFLVE